MSEPRRLPTDWRQFVALFWQVLLGGALVAIGLVAIFLAWYSVSGTSILQAQLTYLVSGGIGGFALVVLGGMLLVSFQIARQNALLRAVVERGPAPVATNGSAPGSNGAVIVPTGAKTYHRPECIYAVGKTGKKYEPGATALATLERCAVCEP